MLSTGAGNQLERLGVRWSHNGEVSTVERGDHGNAETLGDGDEAGICSTTTEIGVAVGAMCPIRPNGLWALDFQFDVTVDGRTLKLLNVVDEYTRECPTIVVDRSIDADRVVAALDAIAAERASPPTCSSTFIVSRVPIGLRQCSWLRSVCRVRRLFAVTANRSKPSGLVAC